MAFCPIIIYRKIIFAIDSFEDVVRSVFDLRVSLVHVEAGIALVVDCCFILHPRLLHDYLHARRVTTISDKSGLVVIVVWVHLINFITLRIRTIILATIIFWWHVRALFKNF